MNVAIKLRLAWYWLRPYDWQVDRCVWRWRLQPAIRYVVVNNLPIDESLENW